MVIGFSIADGALSKGVCVSEGISGLYSATIKDNKIYAFGYNIANADKQASSLFEFDGEIANENVIATTNEPASAGYPTTFYAKFVNRLSTRRCTPKERASTCSETCMTTQTRRISPQR